MASVAITRIVLDTVVAEAKDANSEHAIKSSLKLRRMIYILALQVNINQIARTKV